MTAANGPTVRNSSPVSMAFSADSQYFAGPDHSIGALRVYRTSDWSSVRTFAGAALFRWNLDSASLWLSTFQRVRVSDGAVLQTATFGDFPSAIAPNNQSGLATVYVNGQASNLMRFLRAADGSVQLEYALQSGSVAWTNDINSTGTQFTYEICPSSCTIYVAQMPAL